MAMSLFGLNKRGNHFLALFAWAAILSKAAAHQGHIHRHHHHDHHNNHRPRDLQEQSNGTDDAGESVSFSCGTTSPTEEELAQVAYDYKEFKEIHGPCNKTHCPNLSWSESAPSGALVVRTYWNNIRRSDGTGGMSRARVEATIDFMNDAFEDAGIYFELRRSLFVDNSIFYNAQQGTRAERQMKNALREGDGTVLNIYSNGVAEIGQGGQRGVLGYATYPWQYSPNNNLDGVVIDVSVCTGGDEPELGEGDVLVHEVGHWFGLLHVFEGQNCSGLGDLVDDTPPQRVATYGCPDHQDSCPDEPGEDSVNNYMDFSNNECMTQFTDGQIERMLTSFAQFRVPGPSTAPTISPAPTKTAATTKLPTAAPTEAPAGICFSGQATVTVQNQGPISMPNLMTGDKVLTSKGYQTLYAFAHQDSESQTEFLQIHTQPQSNNPLEISSQHLLFVEGKEAAVPANTVQVGDILQSSQSRELKVIAITTITRNGIWAPLTPSGTVVIDGIVSSCYIALQDHGGNYIQIQGGMSLGLSHHSIAHLAMTPVRMICIGISPKLCNFYDQNGLAYFAKFGLGFAEFADHLGIQFQVPLLVLYLVVFGCLYAVEYLIGPTWGIIVVGGVFGFAIFRIWSSVITRFSHQENKKMHT